MCICAARCVWRCNANAVQLLPYIKAWCYLRAFVTCAYVHLRSNYCCQILQHMRSYLHSVNNFAWIEIDLDFGSSHWAGSALSCREPHYEMSSLQIHKIVILQNYSCWRHTSFILKAARVVCRNISTKDVELLHFHVMTFEECQAVPFKNPSPFWNIINIISVPLKYLQFF